MSMLAPVQSRLVLLLGISLSFSHCAAHPAMTAPSTMQQQRIRIFGKITEQREDGTVLPLPGAWVAAVSHNSESDWGIGPTLVQSNHNGDFSFELSPGAYDVSATLAGRLAEAKRVTAVDEHSPYIELRLGHASSSDLKLSGSVTDSKWKPQAGARVVARRLDAKSDVLFASQADSDGNFEMPVTRGKYALVALQGTLRSREVTLPPETLNSHSTSLILLSQVEAAAPQSVVNWLRQRALPLQRHESDLQISDAAGVLRLVGDAQVVGLGESAHGGHEFAQTKVRLFQLLVEEAGFTTFAIEASAPEAADVDRYVNGGDGDPSLLISRMRFWVTNIDELLDLVKWMRAYNAQAAHTQKLHFVGIDMQYAPRGVERVLEYLSRVDPPLAQRIAPQIEALAIEFNAEHYRRLPQTMREQAAAAVAETVLALDQRRDQFQRRSSAEAWSNARAMAQTVSQFVQLFAVKKGYSNQRDRFMADNVLALLHAQPKLRLTLWAANAHIAAAPFLDWDRPLGRNLRDALGKSYVALGFVFNHGAIHAYGDDRFGSLRAIPVESALPGSIDETCSRVGLRSFMADLRGASGEVNQWLAALHRTHDMGASYSEVPSDEYWPLVSMSESYDALIYIDEVTPTHLRNWRKTFWPPLNAQPQNLKFDAVPLADGSPAGWAVTPRSTFAGYRARIVSDSGAPDRSCALIERSGSIEASWYGSLSQDIDATSYRSQKIRVSASARLETSASGIAVHQAQLWASALSNDGNQLQLMAMPEEPIRSANWARYSVTITVPNGADRLRIGIAVDGSTAVRLADVAVEHVD